MFPEACFVSIWFLELICWDDLCLMWHRDDCSVELQSCKRITKVAKGRGRRHFTFIRNGDATTPFLVEGWKAISNQNYFHAFRTDKLYHPLYVKFIWTWKTTKTKRSSYSTSEKLIRLHGGPFLSPLGMAYSQKSPELDLCPWPLQSAAELCLFKNQT